MKNKELKKELKRYMFLAIGCFLIALAYNVFFAPHNIVTGGVSGIALVLERTLSISRSHFIFIVYGILLILSYFTLGYKTTKYSLIGSIMYPLFVYLTEDMGSLIYFNADNVLLITIFGALISGIGSGLTFKYGFSTGGSDIICQMMSKFFKISIGDSMKILNGTIILGSGFFLSSSMYAWELVMYAIITVYIISMLNDKLLLGISGSKAFYVITNNETDIKKFLINDLKKGVTVLDGRGGYTGDMKKVLLCVIPTKEYFLAKQGILERDKDAIILINDVYQSSGIE